MSKRPSNEVEIAYSQVAGLYIGFYSKHGVTVTTVRECSPGTFRRLAFQSARTARGGDALLKEIRSLDFEAGGMHAKWYVLNCLAEAGARPFWARTWIDATIPAREPEQQAS